VGKTYAGAGTNVLFEMTHAHWTSCSCLLLHYVLRSDASLPPSSPSSLAIFVWSVKAHEHGNTTVGGGGLHTRRREAVLGFKFPFEKHSVFESTHCTSEPVRTAKRRAG